MVVVGVGVKYVASDEEVIVNVVSKTSVVAETAVVVLLVVGYSISVVEGVVSKRIIRVKHRETKTGFLLNLCTSIHH